MRRDLPDDTIYSAAVISGVHDMICQLPSGYETILERNGAPLSGGQKQRIALARLMLKDPPIVILDDTTSSVDVETERRIQAALPRFKRGRTTFVISHRISSVQNADVILVVSAGRVAESGTHAELVSRGGYYSRVCAHQTRSVLPGLERDGGRPVEAGGDPRPAAAG